VREHGVQLCRRAAEHHGLSEDLPDRSQGCHFSTGRCFRSGRCPAGYLRDVARH
jgi:hypothetical protein